MVQENVPQVEIVQFVDLVDMVDALADMLNAVAGYMDWVDVDSLHCLVWD